MKDAAEILKEVLAEIGTGKGNALTASEIYGYTGIKGATLRSVVNYLRSEGIPVCSGKTGYYLAEKREEIIETLDHLVSRQQHMGEAIRGLMNVAMEV